VKRSEIEEAIVWAKALLAERRFCLPPFGQWTLGDWRANYGVAESVRRLMLGWDVTDYGMGDFAAVGSILFTLRNGDLHDRSLGTPYAEKVIPVMDGQRLPMHYHAMKTEDIINRGGGLMHIALWNALADGGVDGGADVRVFVDGILRTVKPGEELLLAPGSSISLTPRLYHIFGAKQGTGPVLVGEVSSVNDDNTDNYFYEKVLRFTEIEEDVPLTVPLCNEYDRALG